MRFYITTRFTMNSFKMIFGIAFLCLMTERMLAQTDIDDTHYNNLFNSDMNTVDASSPSVKQFQRYNLSDVKEYSGKADISIPIFNIKIGEINFPISINYDTGGVKVSQESSNVGLGWSMSNILITRKIMDGQDFEELGKTENEYNSDPDPYLKSTGMGYFKFKLNNSPPLHKGLAKIDRLPDIYTAFLPSGVSSFFYEDINSPKELTSNEIKIQSTVGTHFFDQGFTKPTKDFFSIKITDANGLLYEFNDFNVAYFHSAPAFSDYTTNIPQITNWFISKISDPSTNKTVEFIYENSINNFYVSNDNVKSQRRTNFMNFSGCFSDLIVPSGPHWPSGYFFAQFGTRGIGCTENSLMYDNIINAVKNYQLKRLKRINFPEGYLLFEYNHTRQDIPANGDNLALTKIKLFDYNNKLIKDFTLNYSYFSCTNIENSPNYIPSDIECKRLQLTSVQEMGMPPYKFSYFDENSLPRKSSRAMDFLGYYNGTHINYSGINPYIIPKLYYYPNKGAWSILPFDIQGEEYFEMKDQNNSIHYNVHRKSVFEYTKKGILEKIIFPTGGSEKYEYELNTFRIFDTTIHGGGLRVKKQTLEDGRGNQTFTNYQYLDDSNVSSGQLVRPPTFGFPQGQLFNSYYELNPPNQEDPPGEIVTDYQGLPNWYSRKIYNTFFIVDKDQIDSDINNGTQIGYAQVKKIHSDGSYEKIKFTSRLDYPDKRGFGFFGYNEDMESRGMVDEMEEETNNNNHFGNILVSNFSSYGEFLQTNSNFEGSLYTDFSRSRGKPLSVYKYDVNNTLRKKTEYNYEKRDFNNVLFLKPIYSPRYNYRGTSSPYHGRPWHNVEIFSYGTARIYYNTSRFKPISIKETEYLPSKAGITEHVTEQKFTYINNPFSNRVSEIKHSLYEENSTIYDKTSIGYAFKYPDTQNLPYNNSAIAYMRNNNMLNKIIVAEKRKIFESGGGGGELLIDSRLNTYLKEVTTSNLPLIGNTETQGRIDSYKYDSKGNVIEFKKDNGIPVSIVWGYNQLYPIAKIEGISYSSIPASLITNAINASNADNDGGYGAVKEDLLRTALSSFRTNPTLLDANVLITTYTYDPLIGLTSVTDPIGTTGFYEYDSNGRLVKVIDENGKELKGFEYNIPTP